MDRRPPRPAAFTHPSHDSAADPELDATLAAFTNLDYRDRFWPGRAYEDQCDRIALRALLPPAADRLVEVGAGFGRLADEYRGWRQIVLLDPSEAMLDGARERLGHDPRISIVLGEAQRLPFADGAVDALVCVRVVHHFQDPRPAFAEFARVLRPGGVLVLEAANKRNLKSILAYLARRHRRSPFARGSEPYHDVTLIPRLGGKEASASEDAGVAVCEEATSTPTRWSSTTSYVHAPADVRAWLRRAGFSVDATRSAGLLRPAVLTRHVPAAILVRLEHILQPGLATIAPGPSLYVRATRRPVSPSAATREQLDAAPPTSPGRPR
jgi:SAM-dependent methyltransferase